MPQVKRIVRVNELIKREIADLLEKRPFESDCLISVTEVDTSPDLRHARVSISVFGGTDKSHRQAMNFLEKNRFHLQKKMSKDVVLKYTPVLEFKLDKNLEDGDKVLRMIAEMEAAETKPLPFEDSE